MKSFIELYRKQSKSAIEFHKELLQSTEYKKWDYIVDKEWMKVVFRDFLEPLDISYIDEGNSFYFSDKKVRLYFLPYIDNSSSFNPYTDNKVQSEFSYKLYLENNEQGIRLLQLHEDYFVNEIKLNVFLNALKHALGKNTENRIYARDCEIEIIPAIQTKPLFLKNNIQGYRNANTAFMLVHKKTQKIVMCYTIGHAHFGKGLYDAEIARGMCILGYSVIGGASKLWKTIQDYYLTRTLKNEIVEKGHGVNSIIYYVDLNLYNGRSISKMGNTAENSYMFLGSQSGFRNLWIENKELKEREPSRHSFIMEQMKQGKIAQIPNAGTSINVWVRSGVELNEKIKKFIAEKKK